LSTAAPAALSIAGLALANRQDREAYTAAKTNFVRAVLNHDR